MRVLALVTDAYGESGGIAHYNRALLAALCAFPKCEEVVALPRAARVDTGTLPAKLRFVTAASGGKVAYSLTVLRELVRRRRIDIVFCGHINLLPLAWLAARVRRAPLVLHTHGIDAFEKPRSALRVRLTRGVDLCIAVSRVTRAKVLGWSGLDPDRCIILPPIFEEARFAPGVRDPALQQRFGLRGKRVLLTVGRLACERYKGHEAILHVLPELLRRLPDLVYVIAGDGDDRARLEMLARELGVASATRFAGAVSDADLPALYRLADVFAMPSTGEGFGIVYLEAAASGVPVVAGDADGARDALRDGALGLLVDARRQERIRDGILQAFNVGPLVPALSCFGFDNFAARLHAMLAQRVPWPEVA